jgi:hypothetical protein
MHLIEGEIFPYVFYRKKKRRPRRTAGILCVTQLYEQLTKAPAGGSNPLITMSNSQLPGPRY